MEEVWRWQVRDLLLLFVVGGVAVGMGSVVLYLVFVAAPPLQRSA